MNETKKRIEAYKAALPDLRERVIAVALLLAMSLAMMTSASFAWLTLSRAPQLTGVNTTVASNGNLEIALVQPDGSAPGESAIGDSSASKNQSITGANITWGNLVNLSDPSYGLDNLTLRPAQLNTTALLESPLYGALYSKDGRITQLSSNFGYASWVPPEGNKPGYFAVSDDFGVRAISSTTIEAVGAEAIYYNMVSEATAKNLAAGSMYLGIANDKAKMQSLATMMGLYMTARMDNDGTYANPSCDVADIQNLSGMYEIFLSAFDAEADAMASLANLQLFLLHGEGNYVPYTAERICATTSAKLLAEGIQITNLEQFLKDRNTIASDLEKLKTISSSGTTIKWLDSGLNGIVNNLVNVGECTMGDGTKIKNIGVDEAMGYLSGTQEAIITNGILYNFEVRTGSYISVKGLTIKVSIKRSFINTTQPVTADVHTSAPSAGYTLFNNDLEYAKSLNDGDYEGGIPVAEDTYGLAIDLWVRTNAPNSYLTLEGNVITESETVRATGTDANGKTVELYTVTISGTDEVGQTFSYTLDLYQMMGTVMAEDGTQSEQLLWYKADTHVVLTDEERNGATPLPKMEEVITVVGFEGENRIWDGNTLLSADATTQGSGSCYVYYADTPEDQARSLALLEAFNVAFVDGEGRQIGAAIMDTEHFYAVNGRVIVPLVLDPNQSVDLGEDLDGNEVYAITPLQPDVATRITVIVYLDGTKLTNEQVLAASDIQGKLNIQFGSSEDLHPISNEDLASKELRVSATVDNTYFDYETFTGDMITNVTVKVDGDEPKNVTAFFLRAINASQGSREEAMTFTKNDSGDWVASHEFTVPGNYVLRSVQLDGVDYDLDNPPTVTVEGFTLKSLTCDEASDGKIHVLSAANSSEVNLSLQFASSDPNKLPKVVQGRFLRTDGTAVNINFQLDATTQIWSGTATFLSSGDYTMHYLVLDGEYAELDPGMWLTAKVTLGMRVAVYTTSPHQFKFAPTEMAENEKLLAMQLKIMDNTGKEMPGLSGVKLTYHMKGSSTKKMDTDLTWNGSYYVGELRSEDGGPGIWEFSNVVVGANTLTTATVAPTFTIQSPEPPEYISHNTVAYQYKPNNDAVMNVQISNSSAASVQAYLVKNGAATGTWVTGSIGSQFISTEDGKTPINNWYFSVPKDLQGYQDGNWTLTALRLWDVFAKDGTPYTEDAPLEFDVSDTNNKSKVVVNIYVEFPAGQSKDFGKAADGTVTGKFMDTYTVSGLNVVIRDFEGPVKGISNVKIEYVYGGDSVAKGGYSGGDIIESGMIAFTVNMAVDPGDPTKFVQSGSQTLRIAGTYKPKVSFTFDGGTASFADKTLPVNTPAFTVNSVAPAVEITAASYASASSKTAAAFTKTSTTVYAYQYETTSTVCGQTFRYKAYNQPFVTIKLSGYGNASSATMTFKESTGGAVLLYTKEEGATSVDNYSWTGDGDCTRWVGYWNSQTGDDDRTKAGNLSATTLVLVYNGVSYEVAANFTISNPN